MGQGYLALLVVIGLLIDYCIAQVLHASQGDAMLRDELFRFSLPSFGISLCLCAYLARHKQQSIQHERDALARARLEERLQVEDRIRRASAIQQSANNPQPQT